MRVVIVEDHPLMLSALRETLEQADGFTVVGTANSGLQVEPLVSRTRADLGSFVEYRYLDAAVAQLP